MAEVLTDDRVSRFLFTGSHFAPTTARVKPGAFLPASRDGKTSVFLTTSLEDLVVWSLAEEHVVPHRGMPVLARADVVAAVVIAVGLSIKVAEPPRRHCNIAGWPGDKTDTMERARKLADRSTFVGRGEA